MTSLKGLNAKVWGPPIETLEPPNAIVYVALSTHSGCKLIPITADIDRTWPPGWMDPCTMGAWDLAGRAYKHLNVSENTRLQNLRALDFEMRGKDTIWVHR